MLDYAFVANVALTWNYIPVCIKICLLIYPTSNNHELYRISTDGFDVMIACNERELIRSMLWVWRVNQ